MAEEKFKLPKPTVRTFATLFKEASRGGGVPAKVVENVYRGAESPSIQHRVRGRLSSPRDKRSSFVTHELVERLSLQKFAGSRTAPLKVTKEQSRAAHQFASRGEDVTRQLRTKLHLGRMRDLKRTGAKLRK
jgi:hypothetical protein